MGSTLCSSNHEQDKPDIFAYLYGEDNKEIKIIHNDSIEMSLQSIRPSLVDCQTKLKRSEKRFKDVTINSQPIVLVCGEKQMHCTFQRPEVFLKPEASLVNKIYRILDASNCKPDNIVIGDQVMQYFGVFLCYLSNNPEIIDRIILTHKNSYGIAALQVIYDGRREVLFVDDYILCHNKKPLFSKPVKYSDMWPCLLEKGWFKIKSCLKSKISAVHPVEVFTTFLSYPIKKYTLTDSTKDNRNLVAKYLVSGSTTGRGFGCVITSKVRPNHKIGLSGSKHFYFLKVLEFKGKKYFYLRNPCGQFDFRGSLHELPQQLQNQIVRVTGEYPVPGNFLLTQQEFDEQIESFFIVQYNPNSSISSQEQIFFANSYDAENYVKFQIIKKCEVGIRLQQLNPNQQFAPLSYLLFDVDRKAIISGQTNDSGCFGVHETNLLDNLHQTLLPGKYLLRLKKKSQNKNNSGRTRDRLIISANENVKFQISEAGQLKNQFIFVAKEIAKKKLSEDKNVNKDEIEYKVVWMGDIVVIYINKLNTGKDAINLEVNFPDLNNLQCLSHKINRGYTSLPPFQKDMLIIFQKINFTESTYLGKYSLTPF